MTTQIALTPAQTDAILYDLYARRGGLTRTLQSVRKGTNLSQERIATLLSQRDEVANEIRIHEQPYEASPWSRYFLVTNANGHIHSSTHCSTCFPTTTYGWLTELSGFSIGQVIEEFGEKVCTVCFPEAPSDPRHSQPGRRDREVQEQRAAEKVQRRSAKLEKALLPDGSALKVRVGGFEERVETVVTAERLLVEALLDHHRYTWHRENPRPGFRVGFDQDIEEAGKAAATLVHALEAKTGVSSDTVWAEARVKVARKVKQWEKEGRW